MKDIRSFQLEAPQQVCRLHVHLLFWEKSHLNVAK
jgi:hypothetical protein